MRRRLKRKIYTKVTLEEANLRICATRAEMFFNKDTRKTIEFNEAEKLVVKDFILADW